LSVPDVSVTPLATYLTDSPFPFCPGCGHGPILDHLNRALAIMKLDPNKVVIVTDIGCAGLSDEYFTTSAFHGLHGRSITYASGIKLARPELTVIVIMGDGGTGIGGAHLLSAARRNIGITVLVFNNFNFGMTGGQHSTTTPTGANTATTPGGNLERPMDICATVQVNGASFVYRGTNFDKDLPERIAESVQNGGFGLLDIWDLCTAYYVPRNNMSKKVLLNTLTDLEFPVGVLAKNEVQDYALAYRESTAPELGKALLKPQGFETSFEPLIDQRKRIVLSGSAGGKVGSASKLLARAGIISGLWAAQRDDYPITIKTGHSVSELILSPDAVEYTGIARPDGLLILSDDGLRKAQRYLPAMAADDRVFALPGYEDVKTAAQVLLLDPEQSPTRIPATSISLACTVALALNLNLLSLEALEEAARQAGGRFADVNLKAIEAGAALAEGLQSS